MTEMDVTIAKLEERLKALCHSVDELRAEIKSCPKYCDMHSENLLRISHLCDQLNGWEHKIQGVNDKIDRNLTSIRNWYALGFSAVGILLAVLKFI